MSKSHFFRSDDIFSGPVRTLIKESHAIFSTISRSQTEMSKANVITMSRRYRSIVHECVENLSLDFQRDHTDQIKTFRDIEVIWNLCEVLLLDVNQTGTLIIQLKNWIKMHLDDMRPAANGILESIQSKNFNDPDPVNQESYWKLVVKLVLMGERERAIEILKSHYSFRESDQMQLVASLLERMPQSNQYIVHEFFNKWSNWTELCKRERETGQFDEHPSLLKIVRLLSRDTTVFDELTSDCETWYQLMVAYLLYNDPCINDTDLSELSQRCIKIFKTTPGDFDEIIISAFEYDLIRVIGRSCSYLHDNWWFVAHFIDLLHCSNQLKIHDVVDADKLRETFLQDYASTLFEDEQLWAIGASYLDHCPQSGMRFLEILLSRIPLNSDDELKAHKIISLAKRRGLNSVSSSVPLLMARRWISKTARLSDDSVRVDKNKGVPEINLPPAVNFSNALYWAVKSGDSPVTTYISDQFLHYYCKTGDFPDTSIFERLKRLPLSNERLAFLGRYYEFKTKISSKTLTDNDLSEAGSLIKALIASKIYPRFISDQLHRDVNFLLELDPHMVLPADKTLELMRSIQEVAKEPKINEELELRRGLVRNLARALVTPIRVNK